MKEQRRRRALREADGLWVGQTNTLLACAIVTFACIEVTAASRVQSVGLALQLPHMPIQVWVMVANDASKKEERVPEMEALGCDENPVCCCLPMLALANAARPTSCTCLP